MVFQVKGRFTVVKLEYLIKVIFSFGCQCGRDKENKDHQIYKTVEQKEQLIRISEKKKKDQESPSKKREIIDDEGTRIVGLYF